MKKIFSVLVFVVIAVGLTPLGASAQVARADNGMNFEATIAVAGTSIPNASYTVPSGSNLCMLVMLATNSSITSPSVTWDSGGSLQTMNTNAAWIVSNTQRIQLFYLINPHQGTLGLNASWTTNNRTGSMTVITFSGADQNTCFDTGNVMTASSIGTTPTINAASDSIGGAFMGIVEANNSTAGGGTATSIVRSNSGVAHNVGFHTGGTTFSLTTTQSSGNYAGIGVHVLAFSGGRPVVVGGGVF